MIKYTALLISIILLLNACKEDEDDPIKDRIEDCKQRATDFFTVDSIFGSYSVSVDSDGLLLINGHKDATFSDVNAPKFKVISFHVNDYGLVSPCQVIYNGEEGSDFRVNDIIITNNGNDITRHCYLTEAEDTWTLEYFEHFSLGRSRNLNSTMRDARIDTISNRRLYFDGMLIKIDTSLFKGQNLIKTTLFFEDKTLTDSVTVTIK